MNRGGWTPAQNATHAKAYDEQARGVSRKIKEWDDKNCDSKGGPGLPQVAREYVTQRPVLGSGQLVPMFSSAMTAATATSTVTAANVAAAIGGAMVTVGVGYLIYRGIRMLPSLFPPLWWTIPGNLATP